MTKRIYLGLIFTLTSLNVLAQEPKIADSTQNTNTNFHFQLTTVTQHKFDMPAPYTGTNSLTKPSETQTTLTATIFLGIKLWKNASVYVNPEIAGGSGISSAHGIADFTNGEAFRVGDPAPKLYLARAFFRQTINFSDDVDYIGEGANQVYKTRAKKYLTFILGKFSIADFFDNNTYSHDPRSQFFNWGLMSNGGWDYPANVRGYTVGAVVEYGSPIFKIRAASVMVPKEANGNVMDTKIGKANSNALEIEVPFEISKQAGSIRLLGFYTNAHMGNYDLSIQANPNQPDITSTRSYGRIKYGIGLNLEQAINDHAGLFARASWNDGKNETWAFT
ncbi:MAG: carbohydrate porin, partial [Chryseolinea sp.]